MSSLILPLTLLFAFSPLVADIRKAPAAIPLEVDENGLPIVLVTLHAKGQPEVTRTFRFILDTGAGWTVVDQRIPPAFLWEDPETRAKVTDGTGKSREAASVFIKRLELGGIIRDDIRATVQDLEALMGRIQDRPVDGILGLSFLDHTRFTLDMKAHTVTWWVEPRSGMVELKAGRGSDGMVYATLCVGKVEVPALVDTGMGGGITLPERYVPEGNGQVTVSEGLFGSARMGSQKRVQHLACGEHAWLDVPVGFESGEDVSGIGQDVWSCGPVWFDLVGTPQIRLGLDEKGNLPFDCSPSRLLPVVWEGSGAARRMIVAVVKPGSALEKAGFKVGDQVIRAGVLKGATLTRRGVQDLVASGKVHTWTVRRDGQEIQLIFTFADRGGQGSQGKP